MTPIAPLETVSLTEAGEALGIKRDKVYELARTGELAPGVPVLKFGPRLMRVPVESLRRYIAAVTGGQREGVA